MITVCFRSDADWGSPQPAKRDADTVIWLGDFNYRIDLDRETAIAATQRGDLGMLYEHDQVSVAQQRSVEPQSTNSACS